MVQVEFGALLQWRRDEDSGARHPRHCSRRPRDRTSYASHRRAQYGSRHEEADLVILPAVNAFGGRNDGNASELLTRRILRRAEGGGLICLCYSNELGHEAAHVGGRLQTLWQVQVQGDPKSQDRVYAHEFDAYLAEYGKPGLVMKAPKNGISISPIAGSGAEGSLSALAVKHGKGLIYVLPANFVKASQVPLLTSLCEAIGAHSRRVLVPAIAPIADSFSFTAETIARTKREATRTELAVLEETIGSYTAKKDILFLRDDPLADRVPDWITQHLGINTRRQEEYLEDFWITNDEPKDIVICEAKGVDKNVQRMHITALVLHRDTRELAEDFPSLLVMNTFADVKTEKEKDQRVSPVECKYAVKHHVLIVRTLDLVRLLDQLERGVVTSEDTLGLLTTETGWLEVKGDERTVVKK